MKPRMNQSGQVLAAVLLILVILTTLIPLMVLYTQREAKWTEKQAQNTTAFHLAESGIEKGFRALTTSTITWANLTNLGTQINGFRFDVAYSDVPGGTYAVSITSGPQSKQATIISIGKDRYNKEVRAIQAVYGQNTLGNVAIEAVRGVNLTGANTQVEWGAVVSKLPIITNSRVWPQFWSAGSVDQDTDGSAGVNCDDPNCVQWHSYATLPPQPEISIEVYRDSANATSTYYSASQNWSSGYTYTGGGTVFVEGNVSSAKKVNILGNLIVTGNFTTATGVWGEGTATVRMPREAWKQYGRNATSWTHYRTWDTTLTAFPGKDSTYYYTSGTQSGSKWGVRGFMYVGGNFTTSGGGGGTDIYGAMLVNGSCVLDANSPVVVYYDEEASKNIITRNIILNRVSWQDLVRSWPTGL
ncbi:MAG: hypothetical protein WC969_10670 [Elusimicrobiota bacterium]